MSDSDVIVDASRFFEPANEPLLSVRHLSVELPDKERMVRVLDDVSFDIAPHEVIGIAGESGSGKSMTALAIMGLLPSRKARVTGSVLFRGRDLLQLSSRELQRVRGDEIALIFQEPMTSLHPSWTVGEQIAEALRAHQRLSKTEVANQVVELLRVVGISEPTRRAREYPHQLSGGMQQRVMIAMALACHPSLLIADEPTTALDVTVQAQILELLESLHQEFGMAVMFISHDLGLLAGFCERAVVMYGGEIVEDGPVGEVFSGPQHPYSEALLAATIRPEQKGQALPTIPGFPPRAGDIDNACRFAPRCTYAVEACTELTPPLEQVTDQRRVRCIRHDELVLDGVRS